MCGRDGVIYPFQKYRKGEKAKRYPDICADCYRALNQLLNVDEPFSVFIAEQEDTRILLINVMKAYSDIPELKIELITDNNRRQMKIYRNERVFLQIDDKDLPFWFDIEKLKIKVPYDAQD